MASFVCRLKERRLAAGLTQEELADRVGVRRETIGRLEAGRYNPSLRLAWDIARAVEAPIEDIFLLDERRSDMDQVREYHFVRREDLAHAAAGEAVRELPFGRIEETRRGPRFYFTNRFRSPETMLDFARAHPHLALCNERGEECDPETVAGEVRGMKIGFSGAGSRTGSGRGITFNDLSEWER